jgi:hypothetical protein
MRWTPNLLILAGLLCLVHTWMSLGTGVIAEGLDLTVRNHARTLAEQLSTEELTRIFENPPPDDGRVEWIEDRLSRHWSRSLRSYPGITAALSFGMGVALIGLAIAEGVSRRRTQSPS